MPVAFTLGGLNHVATARDTETIEVEVVTPDELVAKPVSCRKL